LSLPAEPAAVLERLLLAAPSRLLARIFAAPGSSAPRRIVCPILLIAGRDEAHLDAPELWLAWDADLTARRVPGGDFFREEASPASAEALDESLGGGEAR
jgi:hypothetical protein